MKLIRTLGWSMALAAGLFVGSAVQLGAQNPDRDRGKRVEPASVTGELTRVNTSSMTFSVKSTSGAEMLFKYDEQTIVTGAETNPAGLATSNGSIVTVTYRNDSAGNIAAKIEVHARR